MDLQIAVQQAIAIGGQMGQRRRVASAGVAVARARLAQASWHVRVQVRRLFVTALVANERVAQARRLLAFSSSLRTVVTKQAKVGQTAPMAVLLVDTGVARAKENLAMASLRRAVALSQLQAMIGWRGAQLTAVTGRLPAPTRPADLATLRTWMLRSHPNLAVRTAALVAARRAVVLADRMALPNLTLGVKYSRESSPGPGGGGPQHLMLATVRMPLQISQKNQGPRARTRANVRLAEARLEAETLQLLGSLRERAAELSTARERVRLYGEAIVPALQRNLDLLLKAFAVGEVNLNTVSLIRQRLLEATQRYLDARQRYVVARAELEGVVGRDIFFSKANKP